MKTISNICTVAIVALALMSVFDVISSLHAVFFTLPLFLISYLIYILQNQNI